MVYWQETSALASRQSDRLRMIEEDHARLLDSVRTQHSADLTEARERSLNAQQDLNAKHEQERVKTVEQHAAELAAVRKAQLAAEARVVELTASQHELQLQVGI